MMEKATGKFCKNEEFAIIVKGTNYTYVAYRKHAIEYSLVYGE